VRKSGVEDSKRKLKREGRLHREKRTIRYLVGIYCRGHHRPGEALCVECRRLLEYAMERIERCPYRLRKPACTACPVHCYRSEPREEIRRVMRYAGPRMLLRHPVLALLHLLDAVRGKGVIIRQKKGAAG
jgi:hypothetical protein